MTNKGRSDRVTDNLAQLQWICSVLQFASHLSVHNGLLHASLMLLALQATAESMRLNRSDSRYLRGHPHGSAPSVLLGLMPVSAKPSDSFSAQPHVTVCPWEEPCAHSAPAETFHFKPIQQKCGFFAALVFWSCTPHQIFFFFCNRDLAHTQLVSNVDIRI